MGPEMQPRVMRAQKRNLLVMQILISRVTYPSFRNFMLSSKKYTLWGLKSNRKPLEPKNKIC
jgi:hypothetical protein